MSVIPVLAVAILLFSVLVLPWLASYILWRERQEIIGRIKHRGAIPMVRCLNCGSYVGELHV